MAINNRTITWDNLNVAQMDKFDRELHDEVYNSNIFLKKAYENKETYDGGQFIQFPVEFDTMPGGTIEGMQKVTTTDKEFITQGRIQRVMYYTQIAISETDKLDNAGGEGKILDLMAVKYEAAKKTMMRNLTAGLFSDNTSSGSFARRIAGLQYWFPNTQSSGTVAGFNRATYGWFQHNVVNETTSGLAGLTTYKIQGLVGECTDGMERPDLIVTTQTVWDKIWSLADSRQRAGNEKMINLGYQNIDFSGIPIIVDKQAPTGKLFAINTKTLKFYVHKDADMAATPWLQPTDQLAFVKYIKWMGNLVCTVPRYNGVMHGLS